MAVVTHIKCVDLVVNCYTYTDHSPSHYCIAVTGLCRLVFLSLYASQSLQIRLPSAGTWCYMIISTCGTFILQKLLQHCENHILRVCIGLRKCQDICMQRDVV